MKWSAGTLGVVTLLATASCGEGTAPEEARFPIVEGIYNVETSTVGNSCGGFTILDGARIYVFFQDGGTVQFRPPTFDGRGRVSLLDLGIQGDLEPNGEFEMTGTYTLGDVIGAPGPLIGFSMSGRFTGGHVEGVERHVPSFPGGSCEVTFAFSGEEV